MGSEISGAVSGVTTPGASRLQASQSQQRSTTMQRLHGSRGNHDSASGISTDTLRSSDFSGAITPSGSLRVPPEVTFVASPQQTEDHPSECPYCGHRHWPGVHTCSDCCMNAPPNLKPGRESPSSSESGSSSHALPDLEDSSSEGEQSDTGISGDFWENHFQQIWNEEFLHRQNWLLAEAGYRGRLRDWFRASCQFLRDSEAVPRTPWLGYGIQPVSGPLTPCTETKTPVDAPFRAVKPRIGNRCTASGDLWIRISGINRVLFSYCFRQFLCFRSDIHRFDCWRLDRDFTVTASLTVYNGNFNAIRHEGSKAFRNCMDASAIFISYTRNLNPNFSGCRNRIFDFDIPALDLTSFEWTYVLPYARINFPFILPSI